jgi:hypothetical protein
MLKTLKKLLPKGDTGAQGPVGPQGPIRPQGDTGAQGPAGPQQVLKQVPALSMQTFKNFRIETYIDITIDNFKSLIPTFEPKSLESHNILEFYKLMIKSLNLIEKPYTPIYFNLKDGDENIGGCAIWIMKLVDGTSFAYFYGLHRHPEYLFDKEERFKGTSKFLLHSVIEFCKNKNIKFICLPRPCLTSTTKLWYSIGMTFLIDEQNDSTNYLEYLRPEKNGPQQPSNLIDNRSILREFQKSVIETVEQINLNAKQKDGIDYLFMVTSITSGGILFQDNYDIAIKECSTINGGKKISTKKKKTIKKKKRYKNKNINKNKNTNKKNNTNKNKKTNKRRRR